MLSQVFTVFLLSSASIVDWPDIAGSSQGLTSLLLPGILTRAAKAALLDSMLEESLRGDSA